MQHYTVTGMTCASCVAHVEKAVQGVAGVEQVSVSLLTNSMQVEGSASPQAVIKAVEDAGYGASEKGAKKAENAGGVSLDSLKDTETPKMKKRLIASVLLLCPLMYISMGFMMWGWPLPPILADSHVNMALAQMLLTIFIMIINQKFFVSGTKSLLHKSPNMDTLVTLGSGAAFVYSTVVTFLLAYYLETGDHEMAMQYMHGLYFESAAMILTLITVGKMLEARSKGKTTDALKSLMKLAPETAVVLKDGKEVEVPVSEVQKGDLFVVRPGASIPVDGIVREGTSAVNEAALTGESLPVDKEPGSTVASATINQSGFLTCEATHVGEDTTLSKIIQMVSDASATKAPIAKIADKVSGVFVPVVITLALLTMAIWLISGASFGFAIGKGIAVLVISCPCALGLATPVAIMVGNGVGAKNGILFKTAASLEAAGKSQVIVLDKTGTITEGRPEVTDIYPAKGSDEASLIKTAAALEAFSEHPLARAVMNYCTEKQISYAQATDFQAAPGHGLYATVDGSVCYGGSVKYISGMTTVPEDVKRQAEQYAGEGKTPLLFAKEGQLLGIIAVADVIKQTSPQAVKELQNMGIRVIMLTGDNERTARAIAAQVGTDDVIAGVLPDGKEAVVRSFQEQGYTVAMVGDGINDAPALTRAETGIAIGAGADVAVDAADIVLMKSDLLDVPAAIRLSRSVLHNIHENLFWAFFYNCIGIPLAAGALYPAFHLSLNPMFAAAAMSLSSFCVVSNALRLNLCRIYDAHKDKKLKHQAVLSENHVSREEKTTMTKTIKIDGMMCGHCEAHVTKALMAIDGVTAVEASHEKKQAVVTLEKDVPEELFKKAVADCDYTYLGME